MSHTYTANFVHCVFSTKNRKESIPSHLQEHLWAYLLGIANNLRMKTLAIGGTANHVHLLLWLPPTMPAAQAVQKVSRYLPRLAAYAWVLPTVILAYKLMTFTEPQVSVLIPHHSMRWEYFFVIQRTMPTFTVGFGGVDPIRVAEQIEVVAPFYAGLAYSAGAMVQTYDLAKKIFGSSPIPTETEATPTEASQHQG